MWNHQRLEVPTRKLIYLLTFRCYRPTHAGPKKGFLWKLNQGSILFFGTFWCYLFGETFSKPIFSHKNIGIIHLKSRGTNKKDLQTSYWKDLIHLRIGSHEMISKPTTDRMIIVPREVNRSNLCGVVLRWCTSDLKTMVLIFLFEKKILLEESHFERKFKQTYADMSVGVRNQLFINRKPTKRRS